MATLWSEKVKVIKTELEAIKIYWILKKTKQFTAKGIEGSPYFYKCFKKFRQDNRLNKLKVTFLS